MPRNCSAEELFHETFFGKMHLSSTRQLPPMCMEGKYLDRYLDRLCSTTWFLQDSAKEQVLVLGAGHLVPMNQPLSAVVSWLADLVWWLMPLNSDGWIISVPLENLSNLVTVQFAYLTSFFLLVLTCDVVV